MAGFQEGQVGEGFQTPQGRELEVIYVELLHLEDSPRVPFIDPHFFEQ